MSKLSTYLGHARPEDAYWYIEAVPELLRPASERAERAMRRDTLPSMLDPHLADIESWLAAEPKLTALAILGRLSEQAPTEFGRPQHSIVQRLLKTLRTKSALRLIAEKVDVDQSSSKWLFATNHLSNTLQNEIMSSLVSVVCGAMRAAVDRCQAV